jgi:hypothetical protein
MAIASFLAEVLLNVPQPAYLSGHRAEQELWLAIPRLLWVFDIHRYPMSPYP